MKVRYKIRAGAKRSELLLQCNYNPPGFLRNFYLGSHYSWTQRHANTLRQWLDEILTPTKRSQPDLPTFSHVDMLAGSHIGMLYADTDLLKRLLPDALRRWHADLETLWRLLTCWHADSDMLMLTFWHADKLVCWHADALQTRWCWHSDMSICKRADTLTFTRWPSDRLTCWHANVQTRWYCHADRPTWRDADTWTYCHTQMLTWRHADELIRCLVDTLTLTRYRVSVCATLRSLLQVCSRLHLLTLSTSSGSLFFLRFVVPLSHA